MGSTISVSDRIPVNNVLAYLRNVSIYDLLSKYLYSFSWREDSNNNFPIFFLCVLFNVKLIGQNAKNIQLTVPSKAGKDTKAPSLKFEWHLQFFNY